MNIFRFIADMLHLGAILLLLYRIKKARNCIGKSHTHSYPLQSPQILPKAALKFFQWLSESSFKTISGFRVNLRLSLNHKANLSPLFLSLCAYRSVSKDSRDLLACVPGALL